MRFLGAGALGTLAAGAFLYSGSGGAVGGDDTHKISRGEASSTFFNRITEQIEFKKRLGSEPGVITELVGPQYCGKTVRSAFLCTFLQIAGRCWRSRTRSICFVQLFLIGFSYQFLFVAEIFSGACWPI